MSKLLCIETSTEVCSVALVENGELIAMKEDASGMNHSKLLTVFIQAILEENELKAADLDAVAVSEGPGSYTGLRIGVSAAKGLCYGANLPLIAVNPLDAMVSNVIELASTHGITENDLLIPMIDARRMEVYAAKYDLNGERIAEVTPIVINETSFEEELENFRIYYFGNGAAKCAPIVQNDNFILIDNVVTSAKNMAKLATAKFNQQDVVDVAYFEPFYLKNFIATTPKKNILGN